MGIYYPDPRHKELQAFDPDDTAEAFYLPQGASLSSINEIALAKWPDGWKDLQIDAEYIHTYALGYDRYDPSDYTKYLLITRIKNV